MRYVAATFGTVWTALLLYCLYWTADRVLWPVALGSNDGMVVAIILFVPTITVIWCFIRPVLIVSLRPLANSLGWEMRWS